MPTRADKKRPPVALRPYQEEAIAAFVAGRERGLRRMAIVFPTGGGKTLTGISLARTLDARTLWLAHRDELIRQPLEAVNHVWSEATVGVVKAELNNAFGKFIVACVPTLWRNDRLLAIKREKFDLVVYDELHHATAEANIKVIEGLGCFAADGPLLLGLTATPNRTDGKPLETVVEEIVYRLGLLEAIEQGYLSRFFSKQVVLDLKRENVAVTKAGDFNEADLERELLRAGAAEATARAIVEHASDRRTVVFTVSVDQAERTARELVRLGLKAEAVSYLTKDDERRAILGRFHTGETAILCNAFLLSEGYDEPAVNCIVMARPTKSQPLYQQAIGRGLRLYPGKTDCLILDLVGASDLGLVTAERMVKQLEDDRAGLGREKALPEGEAPPAENHEDKLVASYLAAATGNKAAGRIAWIEVERGSCWALGCGERGTIVLRKITNPLDVADPARKFLAQIASALIGGRAHARGINANRCPWPLISPEQFGWRRTANYSGKMGNYTPQGPCIGWVEEEAFFLDMTAARAALRSTLASPGAALHEAGLLVASQPNQIDYAMTKTIGGFLQHVHYLRTADIFAPPPAVAPGAPETWIAEMMPRARTQELKPIGDPGTLDWVFGLAEEHARALGALKLSKADASWRALDATPGQKIELDKRRIPCHSLWLSRGEAADLLTAASVRFRVLGQAGVAEQDRSFVASNKKAKRKGEE